MTDFARVATPPSVRSHARASRASAPRGTRQVESGVAPPLQRCACGGSCPRCASSRRDDLALARNGPSPTQAGPATASAPAAPVSSDSAVAARISNISMNASSPSVMRFADTAGTPQAIVELDKPMEFAGEVKFTAGTALGALTFGFFQIGRPFETYKAIYTRSDSSSNPDILVDESATMRKELPAQDHSGVFFESLGADPPKQVTIGDAAETVKVKFVDTPSTPFQTVRSFNNVDYRLSKLVLTTFFFTGFGLMKGKQALLLATRYWTMRYCEEIPASTSLAKDGATKVPVQVTPVRDCRTHSGDLGEPGARDASGNAKGWGNGVEVSKTFAYLANTIANGAPAKGPDTYDKKC